MNEQAKEDGEKKKKKKRSLLLARTWSHAATVRGGDERKKANKNERMIITTLQFTPWPAERDVSTFQKLAECDVTFGRKRGREGIHRQEI